MRPSGIDLPQRGQSVSSSPIKINASGRLRKGQQKNITCLLKRRQSIRVIDDDEDRTPKPLIHSYYSPIHEKQLTAFDTIGLSQVASSNSQIFPSPSGNTALKTSSSLIMRSPSLHSGVLPPDEMAESLLSCQVPISSGHTIDEDRAPSQFYLPRYDSSVLHVRPKKVLITLKETETFFLFEMLQLTEDLETPEGQAVKKENEWYEYITVGAGSNRKLANAETQTPCFHTKTRSTYLGRKKRANQGTFVNNWVMYDMYNEIDLDKLEGNVVSYESELMKPAKENQANQFKFPKLDLNLDGKRTDDQLARIFKKPSFSDAVRVMERIIAGNLYVVAQKRFKGLIKQDPCSLDLEFTYSLDLLWTYACPASQGRPVSCFRWNYANPNILAAGYGAQPGADVKTGVLLIWSIKNPRQPDRRYTFGSPISCLDWSRDRPNFLAVGFYDGVIKVIDASSVNLAIMRSSKRLTSPSYGPHWQVQWWRGEEHLDYQEQIYTSNQDGRIVHYRSGEDFVPTEIMMIPRIEGEIRGVRRIDHCPVYDIPITRNPGALILRRHPTLSTVYFVGSSEGCLHRCSTNYLHQHVESFLVHDGPVYSMEFSPFCSKIFLTCGADWCARIWADGITEPLITLSTRMACVHGAAWSPTVSTIVASIVNNEICIWDIKRKTYIPTSVTVSPHSDRLLSLEFTRNGNQLVVADEAGVIYIYNLEGMPFPPYNQTRVLVSSIEKALITKPSLLKKLRKIGSPFA